MRSDRQNARISVVFLSWVFATAAQAQNRGVYPLGLSAINSGITPAPGLTYTNSFLGGPEITATEQAQRYRVNGLGLGLNMVLPAQRVTLSMKYFDEFSNQWTYQGYSIQISAGVGF